jgi:hypothetical protein
MGEKRNAYRLLVRKSEGKRPLGRPRRRWVGNIRMDLGEERWGDVNWIDLAQDRIGTDNCNRLLPFGPSTHSLTYPVKLLDDSDKIEITSVV